MTIATHLYETIVKILRKFAQQAVDGSNVAFDASPPRAHTTLTDAANFADASSVYGTAVTR